MAVKKAFIQLSKSQQSRIQRIADKYGVSVHEVRADVQMSKEARGHTRTEHHGEIRHIPATKYWPESWEVGNVPVARKKKDGTVIPPEQNYKHGAAPTRAELKKLLTKVQTTDIVLSGLGFLDPSKFYGGTFHLGKLQWKSRKIQRSEVIRFLNKPGAFDITEFSEQMIDVPYTDTLAISIREAAL
jgi:hypothetical protein